MSQPLDSQGLHQAALFQRMTERDANLAAHGMEAIKLAAGEVLFSQGDPGDAMYFVVSGELQVRLQVPGAPDRTVSNVGANNILGEMSLLLDEPRAATVVAATDAELWKVSREKFQDSISWNERWANQFLFYMAQVLARRLAAMNRDMVELVAIQQPSADAGESQRIEQIFQHMFENL